MKNVQEVRKWQAWRISYESYVSKPWCIAFDKRETIFALVEEGKTMSLSLILLKG